MVAVLRNLLDMECYSSNLPTNITTKFSLTNQFSLILLLLCLYNLFRDKLWFETSLQDLDMAESSVDKVCLRDCPEHEHCNVAARDCVCDYGYVRNRRQDCISTGQLF